MSFFKRIFRKEVKDKPEKKDTLDVMLDRDINSGQKEISVVVKGDISHISTLFGATKLVYDSTGTFVRYIATEIPLPGNVNVIPCVDAHGEVQGYYRVSSVRARCQKTNDLYYICEKYVPAQNFKEKDFDIVSEVGRTMGVDLKFNVGKNINKMGSVKTIFGLAKLYTTNEGEDVRYISTEKMVPSGVDIIPYLNDDVVAGYYLITGEKIRDSEIGEILYVCEKEVRASDFSKEDRLKLARLLLSLDIDVKMP